MISHPVQDYVLSFAKGVEVETPSADRIVVRMPVTYKELILGGLSPGLREAVDMLASTGATEDKLAGIVLEKDSTGILPKLYYLLKIFIEHRILCYSVACNGQRIATLAPASASFSFSPVPVGPEAEYILSRFAYIHRSRNEMVIESPLAHSTITLYEKEAALIAAELAKPKTLVSLRDRMPQLPTDTIVLFLQMLVGSGFACEVKPHTEYQEENEALVQWNFHDLLFHARSRFGRHANPYGGTYRFLHKINPLPAIKPPVAESTIPLYRPDMDALRESDHPFTLVLEERKSIREYSKKPVTANQLGEFLFRAVRVKSIKKNEYQDLSTRPYPGGGAIYELELYLTVHECQGIPSGLYHYCPDRHVLEKISDPTDATDALLKDAGGSAGLEEFPQILITVTARFQRLTWKYESMAYNLILKNVGVLYQTMYLVATAMDLAPCALGGGNSDLFAKAAGLDYYSETSVGEFMLGSKRI
jgi:oxazoline/thiazoline dehydrogenase